MKAKSRFSLRASSPVGPTPSATRRRPFPKIPWGRVLTGVGIVAAIGALVYSQLDIEEVHAQADRLNPFVAFALLTVLPLLGFPASVLHVAAGIRFGGKLGLALVALSILLQLLASYGIVQLWRERFEKSRWLKRLRERVPKGAHASICVFTVFLPGAPFAAINYVLPLLGVPLRIYLLCCLPLHALRSTVTVFFGDQSDRLTPPRLAGLAVYALLVMTVSWWMYRRVRAQLEGQPSTAGGRKQPA